MIKVWSEEEEDPPSLSTYICLAGRTTCTVCPSKSSKTEISVCSYRRSGHIDQ